MWPQQFLPGDATVTQVLTVSLHCWFWREQISQSRLRGITSRKHLVAQLRQGSPLPHPFHVGAAKHYPLLVIASFLASPWLCFSHGKKKKKKKAVTKGLFLICIDSWSTGAELSIWECEFCRGRSSLTSTDTRKMLPIMELWLQCAVLVFSNTSKPLCTVQGNLMQKSSTE